MIVQLDVLGSSGTYPAPDRPASGYLVSHLSTRVLCDVGFGAFAELTRRIAPDQLDAVRSDPGLVATAVTSMLRTSPTASGVAAVGPAVLYPPSAAVPS